MALPFLRRPGAANLDRPQPATAPRFRPSYLDDAESTSSLAVSWRGLLLAMVLFACLAVAAVLWF
jgi:hypothetical protein